MATTGRTADDLTDALLAGDRRAHARAISLVENDDPEGWELVRRVYPKNGRAAVVFVLSGGRAPDPACLAATPPLRFTGR